MTPPPWRLVALLCLAATSVGCSDPPVVQPIAFNHLRHTQAEIDCSHCHDLVYDEERAGLPTVSACMQCHDLETTKDPATRAVIATLEQHERAGTQVPWVLLYELPQHVYFSHRRHTDSAEIECSTCHGDVGDRETPPPYPIERTLDMDGCMDCHEEHDVEADCSRCHR